MPRFLSSLLRAVVFFLAAATAGARQMSVGAIVLVNSLAPDYADFPRLIEPYLLHFGVPYAVRDVSRPDAFDRLDDCGLVMIGHRGLDAPRRFMTPEHELSLAAAIKNGTGLVSFDGLLVARSERDARPIYSYPEDILGLRYGEAREALEIAIGVDGAHYIANQRPAPRIVKLKASIIVPGLIPGEGVNVIARAGKAPLILAAQSGQGRAVVFASYDWMQPGIKGKLYGLDDLVWRAITWAARKPFVIRGMPKFLALRVDDVSGFGIGANQHLGWIETANQYGLKPWVGVFIDDLREDPEAVRRLARLTQQGLATASVHARRWTKFFYLDEPLATDDLKRNIAGKPWPTETMAANWTEAEKFFAQNGIVKSKLVLPHFYEFATNDFEGLKNWGADVVGTVIEPGLGYGTRMPEAKPYLTFDAGPSSGADPIFIADWLKVPGHPEFDRQFFNFVLEVRDVTGYEWAPSGVPVEEAIRRGVEESQREFDSLLPAVLFTHESDHIRHISPADWDRILAGVMKNIQEDSPIPVTLDFLGRYLRALNTSIIRTAGYDSATRQGLVAFTGASDVPTKCYVYETDTAPPRELEVPAFNGSTEVRWMTDRR